MDTILISDLELVSYIGVTSEERAEAQRLTVSLEIHPKNSFTGLGDDLAKTVNYFTLSRRVQQVALDHPRNLIETLAQEIAEMILREFSVARVTLELRKYILPDTQFVAVKITRPAHIRQGPADS